MAKIDTDSDIITNFVKRMLALVFGNPMKIFRAIAFPEIDMIVTTAIQRPNTTSVVELNMFVVCRGLILLCLMRYDLGRQESKRTW